ncbi:tetratricopeptide repeat protein [Bacillaceae bacterium SIJ1]|uniref:tetratricopeptide repeat protein n=1 Tax=Litoribacterium kuwaitense TaxID=1398745 RepID=UPI0013EB0A50|nr:tetratricopeptide repeat protein [Litoribacterium kuwaitense]NGP43719.1 tetratricopeptide repeat protein [Litoribacterium kuwaitense]
MLVAEAYSLTGQFENAYHHYTLGLKEKTTVEALFGFGLVALKVDEAQAAIHALEQLKDMDADFVSLYKPLAEAYEEEGLYEEALAAVKEGIAKDDTQVELYVLAGRLSERQHEKAEAIQYYKEALLKDQWSQEAVQRLVKVYEQEEEDEALIDLLQNQADEYPDPDSLFALAKAYHRQEAYEEARQLYEETYPLLKHRAAFVKFYVRFMLEEGKRLSALKALETFRAHTSEPLDDELEMLYEDLLDER